MSCHLPDVLGHEGNGRTWRRAGLDEFDTGQPPGASDLASKDYLEKLFAEQIEGHRLLVNNSRWANFRTRRTQHWHVMAPRPVVLLGDAVHTAHFSVGSGTKMAMEDAVALSRALAAHPENLESAMYASVGAAASDGPVDLAVLCVPAPACPGVLAEAAAADTRAAVICGGGFAEAGGAGVALQRELASIVADTGIRVLGPNTSGFIVPSAGLAASFGRTGCATSTTRRWRESWNPRSGPPSVARGTCLWPATT